MKNLKCLFENRQSEIATAEEIKPVGDYEKRRSGRTPGGKLARLNAEKTRRMRNERPTYLSKVKRHNTSKGKGGKGPDGKKGGREAQMLDSPGYLSAIRKIRKITKMLMSRTAANIKLISRIARF